MNDENNKMMKTTTNACKTIPNLIIIHVPH